LCCRFGKIVSQLDVLKLITIENLREIEMESTISKQKALIAMATINKQAKIYCGFDSIFQISLRLRLLWILVPFFPLLKVSHIGNYLYNELAVKRNIIPIHCTDKCNINHVNHLT